MNKIDNKFKELKKKHKKALIPFITVGDPDINTTEKIVINMVKHGSDIIELGIPYSDPLADGPIIQKSSQRSLKNGIKVKDIMKISLKIRKKVQVPLIYLVYYNSVFVYGVENFIIDSHKAGIDGIIIPDLPIEERTDIINIANKYDMYLIPLVAPTSNERIKNIVKGGGGFVYCVSKNGVTGIGGKMIDMDSYISTINKYTNLPKAVGFGISGPEMANKLKQYYDGVIIGSAIINVISKSKDNCEAIENTGKFIDDIRKALDN